MVLRSVLVVIAAIALTGCAQQQQAAAGPRPVFQRPQDIRPQGLSVPTESQPLAAAKPAPAPARVTGPWAPPVKSRDWKYIVLHHSASPTGNAALFDREHREKGWDELGYHFVIDNGRGGADGRIELGPRWVKQKWGAHAKTPDNRFNDYGIGICFVGNFEQSKPTAKQLESAAKLVAWLMQTYDIPQKNVIGHEDTGKQTLCPGRNLSVARVRGLAEHVIADAGNQPTPLADDGEATVVAHVMASPTDRELIQAR
jgi:hypothetical protein